jgi:hypothetical protein
MPDARYFLADSVLTAMLALNDADCRQLLAAFDQVSDSPSEAAVSIGQDWDGRIVYLARQGRFEIGYIISPHGEMITITLVRPRSR